LTAAHRIDLTLPAARRRAGHQSIGAGGRRIIRSGQATPCRGNAPMRMVAGCFIAVLALTAIDQLLHHGQYRAHAGKMVGHMMTT
jgi:hypothetical protein